MNIEEDNIIIEKYVDRFIKSFSFFTFDNILFVNLILLAILYIVYNLDYYLENYLENNNFDYLILIYILIFLLINYLLYIYFTKLHMPYLQKQYNLYKLYEPKNYESRRKNILYI